jgi:thiosulfate/3-mercaptopyruvate sulfurtransferase
VPLGADSSPELYRRQGLDSGSPTSPIAGSANALPTSRLVLHELLGNPDVKNYDGSRPEYGSLIGVPIALGNGR